MTHTPRRLAATVLALGLVMPLSACGQDNPFGRIVKGQDPNATSTTDVSAEITGASDPDSFSPSWSSTEPTPMWSDSATETETDPTPASTDPTPASTDSPTGLATSGSPASPDGVTSTTAPASTSPAAQAQPSTSVVQVDGRTISGVPSGLGFPTQVAVEGTSSFEAGGGSVVMSAPAEKEIFSFYRSALPSAGFRVVGDTAGTLTFTGKGFRGSLIGTGDGAVLTWAPTAD